jgi:hypothetical protein
MLELDPYDGGEEYITPAITPAASNSDPQPTP